MGNKLPIALDEGPGMLWNKGGQEKSSKLYYVYCIELLCAGESSGSPTHPAHMWMEWRNDEERKNGRFKYSLNL